MPARKLLSKTYQEVITIFEEFLETEFSDIDFSCYLDFPENFGRPCSKAVESLFAQIYAHILVVFNPDLSEELTDDEEFEIYSEATLSSESMTDLRCFQEAYKSLTQRALGRSVDRKVLIRFDETLLLHRPSKSSYIAFEDDLVYGRLNVIIDKSKFHDVHCKKFRSILILAVVLHELGHVALPNNIIHRIMNGSNSKVSGKRISELVTTEDEQKAWVFSHVVRSFARAQLEDKKGMAEKL